MRIFQGQDDRWYVQVYDGQGPIITTEGDATAEAARARAMRFMGAVLRFVGSTIPAFDEDDPTKTMRVTASSGIEPVP